MRIAHYTIPLSIALFCLGLVMYLGARPAPNQPTGIDFSQPKHPVTEKMTSEADKMARQEAPKFELAAIKGSEQVQISGERSRPQFVLFILDGCPCSIDAQPLFNAFYKHWKEEVEFVGVIDSEGKKARAWVSDYRPAFPVVSDAKKQVIHAYEAKQSVYSALISKDGHIVKLWPGYSRGLLKEMNDTIAKELGETSKPFDPMYAPAEKTSGCFF